MLAKGRRDLAKRLGCDRSVLTRFSKKMPIPYEKEILEGSVMVKYYDVEKCRKLMRENSKANPLPKYLQE